jgi:hypothetical protein
MNITPSVCGSSTKQVVRKTVPIEPATTAVGGMYVNIASFAEPDPGFTADSMRYAFSEFNPFHQYGQVIYVLAGEQSIPSFEDEIQRLRHLSNDFNGYLSEAPNDLSIGLTLRVMRSAAGTISPSRLVASAEGGVAIYFSNHRKQADIEVFNSGEMVASITDGQGRPEVWQVADGDIKTAIEKISNFLER